MVIAWQKPVKTNDVLSHRRLSPVHIADHIPAIVDKDDKEVVELQSFLQIRSLCQQTGGLSGVQPQLDAAGARHCLIRANLLMAGPDG